MILDGLHGGAEFAEPTAFGVRLIDYSLPGIALPKESTVRHHPGRTVAELTMGHYCRICERERPNEAFSGRGHRIHVCKQCQRLPHAQRQKIEHLDEIANFLSQSNISAKNIQRLDVLGKSGDAEVCNWAAAVLDVARRYPRKRRRYVRMAREQPPLLRRLRQVLGDAWWNEVIVNGALGSEAEKWALNDGERMEGRVTTRPQPDQPLSELRTRIARPSTPAQLEGPGLKLVTIHTDGACQHNPGPGGWAAILRYGTHVKELKGSEPSTTNNRMELQAALAALRALKVPCAVELVTDSKYLRDGVTRWLARWKANGWKTVERAPVKNQDLWKQLDEQCARHQVVWRWVRGHVGHPDNERCDELARAEIARASTRTEDRAGSLPNESAPRPLRQPPICDTVEGW